MSAKTGIIAGGIALLAAGLHCGGEAVIDPPLGTGGTDSTGNGSTGNGSTGNGSTANGTNNGTTAPSTSVSMGLTTTVATGPVTDCTTGCTAIYTCGLENGNCPAFDGSQSQIDEFLFGDGNNGCIAGCETQPLLLSLIDPSDCETTIANIRSANPEFADFCDDG